MIVAWDAPPAASKSGVGHYAARLARSLKNHVTVVDGERQADRHVYHIGNNSLHRPIYQRALAQPDVIVLHDAVLMHYFLGELDESAFAREFEYNYGAWHGTFARDLYARRARSAADPLYFRYPLLKRVCERSRAVIVHSRQAARLARDHAPQARIREIPHFFEREDAGSTRSAAEWRKRQGIKAGDYLFGLFGFLRESKRLLPALRAFAHLNRGHARLLVAGEFASSDLERAASELLALPGVIRQGYSSDAMFQTLLQAVDCGINLRYPSAGESSGIGVRLMGLGKPVLVTQDVDSALLPAATAVPIDPGPAEAAMLAEVMRWLVDYPGEGRAIGRRAAYHVEREHSIQRVTGDYLNVLAE